MSIVKITAKKQKEKKNFFSDFKSFRFQISVYQKVSNKVLLAWFKSQVIIPSHFGVCVQWEWQKYRKMVDLKKIEAHFLQSSRKNRHTGRGGGQKLCICCIHFIIFIRLCGLFRRRCYWIISFLYNIFLFALVWSVFVSIFFVDVDRFFDN